MNGRIYNATEKIKALVMQLAYADGDEEDFDCIVAINKTLEDSNKNEIDVRFGAGRALRCCRVGVICKRSCGKFCNSYYFYN